ncbi:tyrosine-type recombinase/integrase [Sphaerisporangium sp. NBC_01403]|uniref:tyrosine-type recombinase/integrase n=1 Tax=Sphaerisporangium sp. NBC_01403 TaxID=2903599 RepID=UPI0032459C50
MLEQDGGGDVVGFGGQYVCPVAGVPGRTPIEPGNLSTRWRKTRAKAGLHWLRLHDLRHACASFLIACGASPRTVMKTLGHSQIGLTMNTYAHVLPEVERAAVDAVAKRLFG